MLLIFTSRQILVCALCLLFPLAAAAEDSNATAKTPDFFHSPNSFHDCVHLALEQAPNLAESALEIDLKELDRADSQFKMFPSFRVHTQFYLNDVDQEDIFDLTFTADPYNPIEAVYSIRVSEIITEIAVLEHKRVISQTFKEMGELFLHIRTMDRILALREQLLDLAQENRDFFTDRLNAGAAAQLETRMAEQSLRIAVIEREKVKSSRTSATERLKVILGINPLRDFPLDTVDASRQVLSEFDPHEVSMESYLDSSFELKKMRLNHRLQKYSLDSAYGEYIPDLTFGIETEGPDGGNDEAVYFNIGLSTPVWDGLERYRNVQRAKLKIRRSSIQQDQSAKSLMGSIRSILADLKSKSLDYEAAHADVELKALKKQQTDINWQAGAVPFSTYLADRQSLLSAKINAEWKRLEYEKAILNLRHISGKLLERYVVEKKQDS